MPSINALRLHVQILVAQKHKHRHFSAKVVWTGKGLTLHRSGDDVG